MDPNYSLSLSSWSYGSIEVAGKNSVGSTIRLECFGEGIVELFSFFFVVLRGAVAGVYTQCSLLVDVYSSLSDTGVEDGCVQNVVRKAGVEDESYSSRVR